MAEMDEDARRYVADHVFQVKVTGYVDCFYAVVAANGGEAIEKVHEETGGQFKGRKITAYQFFWGTNTGVISL